MIKILSKIILLLTYNVPTTTSTTTTTTTTTTAACPGTGWTPFNGYSYCYVSNSNTDQLTAQSRCQAIGANLVSIHSMAENTFIQNFVGGARVWLGSHRKTGCGTPFDNSCFVNYDGTPFDYTMWSGIAPDNNSGTENCVLINWNGDPPATWNDNSCSDPSVTGYVCKRAA